MLPVAQVWSADQRKHNNSSEYGWRCAILYLPDHILHNNCE